MGRIKLYKPGRIPAGVPEHGPTFTALDASEADDLFAAGVWSSAANDAANWVREDIDGNVWAGGAAGIVAKVRGKNGRRLIERTNTLPTDMRRRTTSIQLSGVARANLERLAQQQGESEGRPVSISDVVERWALGA